jgi:uncharacterized protein YaaW (UPF0174 family)
MFLLLLLPCLLLLPPSQGEHCTQQVEELRQQMVVMRAEMRAEVETMEAKLHKEKLERKVEKTEIMARMDEKMTERMDEKMKARMEEKMMERMEEKMTARMEEKMTARMEEKMTARMEEKMTARMEETVQTAVQSQLTAVQAGLPSAVSRAVRDLPYLMVCAYKNHWTTAGATITYDSILSEVGDGKLDISSGVYTAVTPGLYSTVQYSTVAVSTQQSPPASTVQYITVQ